MLLAAGTVWCPEAFHVSIWTQILSSTLECKHFVNIHSILKKKKKKVIFTSPWQKPWYLLLQQVSVWAAAQLSSRSGDLFSLGCCRESLWKKSCVLEFPYLLDTLDWLNSSLYITLTRTLSSQTFSFLSVRLQYSKENASRGTTRCHLQTFHYQVALIWISHL